MFLWPSHVLCSTCAASGQTHEREQRLTTIYVWVCTRPVGAAWWEQGWQLVGQGLPCSMHPRAWKAAEDSSPSTGSQCPLLDSQVLAEFQTHRELRAVLVGSGCSRALPLALGVPPAALLLGLAVLLASAPLYSNKWQPEGAWGQGEHNVQRASAVEEIKAIPSRAVGLGRQRMWGQILAPGDIRSALQGWDRHCLLSP